MVESPKPASPVNTNATVGTSETSVTSASKSAAVSTNKKTTVSSNNTPIVSATVKAGTFKRDPELDAMLKRKEKIASTEVDYRTLGTKARDMTLDSQSQDGSAMNTMKSWSSQDSKRKYEFKRNPDLDEALQRSQRKMESSASPSRETSRTYTFGRDPDLDAMLKRKAQVASCVVPSTDEVDPNAIRNAQSSIIATEHPSPIEREYDLRSDFKPSTALWQNESISAGEVKSEFPAGDAESETPSENVDGIPAGKGMGRETMLAMEEIMGDLDLSLEDVLSGDELEIPAGGE